MFARTNFTPRGATLNISELNEILIHIQEREGVQYDHLRRTRGHEKDYDMGICVGMMAAIQEIRHRINYCPHQWLKIENKFRCNACHEMVDAVIGVESYYTGGYAV